MKFKFLITILLLVFLAGVTFAAEKESERAQAYYHFLLAAQREASRDLLGAIGEYREALKYDPNSSEIFSRLAQLYIQTNHMDEAILESQKAIENNPDNKEAHKLLGQIYMQKIYGDDIAPDDLKTAISEFHEVHRLDPDDEEVLLSLGQLTLQQDDYTQAAEYLSKYLETNPDSSTAVLSLATAYDQLNQTDKAISILLKYQEEQPPSFYVTQQLADLYRRKGDYPNALKSQKQAYDEDPESVTTIRRYLDLLEKTGNYSEAIRIIEQNIKANPDKPAWTMLLARMLQKSGETDRAESMIRTKIAENPADFDLKLALVQIYEDSEQYQKALQYLQEAEQALKAGSNVEEAERRNDQALLYSHFGYCEQKQEHYEQSNAYYFKSRELVDSEDQQKIDFYIAVNYRSLKDWGRAVSTLKSILDKDTKDTGTWELLSLVYEEKGDLRSSDEIVDKLIESNPGSAEFVVLKAERQQQREQYSESIEYLKSQLSKFPTSDQIFFLLGAASERLKKFDEAEGYFKETLQNNPGNANALNYLGYMLIDQGVRLEESIEYVKGALEIDHDNGAYLDSLGWGYFKLNKLDLAEDNLRLAAEKMKDNAVVHDHLGDLYFTLGKFNEAISHWELALKNKDKEINPEFIHKKIDDTKKRLP